MKRVVFLFLVTILLTVNVSATEVAAITNTLPEYGAQISFDESDKGIVKVFFNDKEEKKMKLVVEHNSKKYIYNVFNDEEYVNYPLQLGEGIYKVSLYENTTGTKYKQVATKSGNVELVDDNAVYLQSVLEIDWNKEDESILLANELTAQALEAKKAAVSDELKENVTLTEDEIIDAIYDYVVKNIQYDYEKINGLDYSYVPHNDQTLETSTGICYDYSALLAGMLRSQGVPTKMAKGYANGSDTYHAWNEIYVSDEQRWVVVDTTNDAYMEANGFAYDLEKISSNYDKVKEF